MARVGGILPFVQNAADSYVEGIGEVEMVIIPSDDFEEVILRDTSMRQQVFKLLTENIDGKEVHLLKAAYDSLCKKTADALLTVYRKYNITDYKNVGLKFSRSNLAALAGVAKESLARTLGEFRDEQLIDLWNDTIYICEIDKLVRLCN